MCSFFVCVSCVVCVFTGFLGGVGALHCRRLYFLILYFFLKIVANFFLTVARPVFNVDWGPGHMKVSEYALKATMKTMNEKPGGKSVTRMRDTEWEGKTQQLYTADKDAKKTPTGMKQILKERKL